MNQRSSTGPRRHLLRIAATALCTGAVALLAAHASAADYPTKAVRMIVPFAPGGSTDLVARIIAAELTGRLGQSVVVENKPGGGTLIGMQTVANAAPDGYTVLFGSSALANYPNLTRNVVLDVQRDLAPVTLVVSAAYAVLVHPSVPVRTVAELIAHAKARPGELNMGSAGSGSANHLAGELFKSMAGVDMVHVQYRGSGPALVAAMAGEVQVIIEPIISARSYIASGKLRALAVTSDRRSSALPELPTASESGLPRYEASFWLGMLAPSGTSSEVVDTLNRAVRTVLDDPKVKEQLAAQGVEPVGNSPAQFAARITDDIGKWGKVIRQAGVQIQ